MEIIRIEETEKLCNDVKVLEQKEKSICLSLPKEGGGVLFPQIKEREERYLSFYLTVKEEHSMAMNLFFYGKEEEEPILRLRFGVLGSIKTFICVDLNWLDGNILFPEAEEGGLKMVCHGRRIERKEVEKVIFFSSPCYLAFNYGKANLYRAFGDDWYEKWKIMIGGQLKGHGMNTIGNWSDSQLLGTAKIPYVTSLPKFPDTKASIFRDFPDVFSDEYRENAVLCAQSLKDRKDDPYMIGYFLRNEPAWAFVDNLILAEEVLYSKERTVCRERLVEELQAKYSNINGLNQAWNCELASFDDLYKRQKKVSTWSEDAMEDMKEFSRKMLRAYVEIPSKECKKVDPNHMILGMRWAWISDSDIVSGWENFDVFSINCYAIDPTKAIQNVVDLKVDLPIMIGEFHFGALDAGLTATGLEGTASQEDRGKAYRYYCERVLAHPYGVGCHYFQCYDQFYLGRFDGENYNIGLFDICYRPYPEMMEQVKECSKTIYEVADGSRKPIEEKGLSIPMIAY